MKTAIVCVLLAFVVACVTASCSNGVLKSVPYKWRNGTMEYCEYKNMKFMVGSDFTDADDCMKCSCTENGLSCCGTGFYAGTIQVSGCEVVADHCEMAILNVNKTALCNP